MIFPIFASVILFSIWLMYQIRKHNQKSQKNLDAFWKKEAEADQTRKKTLDDLDYIVLPEEFLHIFGKKIPENMQESVNFLQHAANNRVVNLSGISNTDLKLRYGAANLELLSAYDANYTGLVRHLNSIGEFLADTGESDKAITVLEYAVSIGSDLIGTYRTLASLYLSNDSPEKIPVLISSATLLPGLTRKPILKMLYSLCPGDKDETESILDILD